MTAPHRAPRPAVERVETGPSERTVRAVVLVVLTALLAVALSVGSPSPAAADVRARTSLETHAELLLLLAHDQARSAPGDRVAGNEQPAPMLRPAPELMDAARAAADRMARRGRLEHDPDLRGRLCCSQRVADNVGVATRSGLSGPQRIRAEVDTIMLAWLRSAPHRHNLLDARSERIGVGVSTDAAGRTWAVAVFDTPAVGSASAPVGLPAATDTAGWCAPDASADHLHDLLEDNIHRQAIACLAADEVVRGTAPERFSPGAALTRGQGAALLVRTSLVAEGDLPPRLPGAFTDVRRELSAAEPVERLAAAGVVAGQRDGRFQPHSDLTRGQLVSQLVHLLRHLGELPDVAHPPRFGDVPATHRNAWAIDTGAALGLIDGYGDDRFAPDALIRRDQAATIMARLRSLLEAD